MKTIEMSEAWPGIYNKGNLRQSQPEPTQKIH